MTSKRGTEVAERRVDDSQSSTLSRGALFVQRLALLALPIAGCQSARPQSDAQAEASNAQADASDADAVAIGDVAPPAYDALDTDASAPDAYTTIVADSGFALPNGDGGTVWCTAPPGAYNIVFYSWNPVSCSGTTCTPRTTMLDRFTVLGTISVPEDAGSCVPVCDPSTGVAVCLLNEEAQARGLQRLGAPGCTVNGINGGNCRAVALTCEGVTRYVLDCGGQAGPQPPPDLPL